MWAQTVPRLLAFSAAGGIFCGFLWDFFVITKMAFSGEYRKKQRGFFYTVEILEDLLFCVISCCTALVVLYYGNSGKFRFLALAVMATGFAAYKVSVGALLLWAAKKVFAVLGKVLRKLLARIKKLAFVIKKKVNIVIKNKKTAKIGKNQCCKSKSERGVKKTMRLFGKVNQ